MNHLDNIGYLRQKMYEKSIMHYMSISMPHTYIIQRIKPNTNALLHFIFVEGKLLRLPTTFPILLILTSPSPMAKMLLRCLAP